MKVFFWLLRFIYLRLLHDKGSADTIHRRHTATPLEIILQKRRFTVLFKVHSYIGEVWANTLDIKFSGFVPKPKRRVISTIYIHLQILLIKPVRNWVTQTSFSELSIVGRFLNFKNFEMYNRTISSNFKYVIREVKTYFLRSVKCSYENRRHFQDMTVSSLKQCIKSKQEQWKHMSKECRQVVFCWRPCISIPVSYTHLDVYKRQPLSWP